MCVCVCGGGVWVSVHDTVALHELMCTATSAPLPHCACFVCMNAAVRGSDSTRTFVLSIFCKEGRNYGFRHIMFNKQPSSGITNPRKWELADKFFPSIQAAITVVNLPHVMRVHASLTPSAVVSVCACLCMCVILRRLRPAACLPALLCEAARLKLLPSVPVLCKVLSKRRDCTRVFLGQVLAPMERGEAD